MLKKLEFREYDAAGVAYQNCKGIQIYNKKGMINDLQALIPIKSLSLIK